MRRTAHRAIIVMWAISCMIAAAVADELLLQPGGTGRLLLQPGGTGYLLLEPGSEEEGSLLLRIMTEGS